MAADEVPFHDIAVVGFGLIGGSIALGVRERWPSVRIAGVDRAPVLAHAAGSGAIDRALSSPSELGDVDLIVLAAPVHQNIALLKVCASQARPQTVITDVGGTKRAIVTAAAELPSPRPAFVGGHPIGGSEQGGFAFARADLFKGRPWIFTPEGPVDPAAMERLDSLAQGLGARPVLMEAAAHDRLIAYLSHLPQLTATVLMEVAGNATAPNGLRFAGRGLVDTTRLAASPADIWLDICASNADAIASALDALIARLQKLRDGLGRGETVGAIFEDASRWRAELMKGRE
jgi:prephenate dehydrogenase